MGDVILMTGKFTAERAQRACDERRKGATIRACAIAAGITHVTLHTWFNHGAAGREPYAAFLARWRSAESEYKAERFAQLRVSA